MTTYACLNVYQEEALLPDCLRSIRTFLPEAKIILIDGAYQTWVRHVRIEAAVELAQGNVEIGYDMLERFTKSVSTDRTIEIAKEFGVEHIVMPPTQCMCGGKKFDFGYYEKGAYLPWESEWKKRSRFFEFGQDGDYYFIVDADERLEGKPEPFAEEHYAVMLKRDDDFSAYPVHRVFRHQPGIKMEGAHMAVWVNKLRVIDGVEKVAPYLLRKEDVKSPDGKTVLEPGAPILKGCMLTHKCNERARRDMVRHMSKGAYYRNGLLKEEAEFRVKHGI